MANSASQSVNRSESGGGQSQGITPTALLYGMAWLVSLIGLLAFRAARLELGTPTFFILLITLGTLFSAWLVQRPLSENTRLTFGFLDATLALFTITAQPSFNALARMPTDPSIEIYLSTSLLWYFTLRTPLMVSPASVLFQGVPVMALFGLIGSYLFAPAVPYLFLAFVVVLLMLLMVAHQLELGAHLPFAIVGRYALLGGLVATMLASGLAFLLWLGVGELVSGLVIGLPFRTPATRSNLPVMPALQVGIGPVTQSEVEVMRVRFLHGDARYLRMDAYDLYTGRGWNRIRMGFRLIEANEQGEFVIYSELPDSLRLRQVHAEITIMGGFHRQLCTPGIPLWLKLSERRRAVGFAPYTAELWLRSPLSPGNRYEVRALVPREEPTLLRERVAGAPLWGIGGESARNPRVRELVHQLTANQLTDYDKVITLKRYIETHAVYNLEAPAYPPEEDVVEYFLFVARQGYCTEFATALAVMCQYAGLRARVASGYLLTERDPDTGDYIVRDKHRHLWTEVYFEGVGWVPFDATQNAPVINAGYLSDGGTGSDSSQGHPLRRWQRLLDSLILAGVLYLLWTLATTKYLRVHSGNTPRTARLYARLVHTLRLMGCPAPPLYQSPSSYLNRCTAMMNANWHNPTAVALVVSLNEPLARLLYAPEADAKSAEAEVQGKIHALQRLLRQELGYPRLIGRAIRLKWHDWCQWLDPSEPSDPQEHGGQIH